jgi:hypothetical protein
VLAQLKGPGEVEAEVLMMRQVHKGSFLIIEGEDDAKFWAAWVRQPHCELVIAGGKATVLGAVARLDGRGFSGAVDVVDDDCDTLLNRRPSGPNVCVTHARDLEAVLLRTPSAVHRILAEYGEPPKVASCASIRGNVVAALLENCLPYGRLRWLAYREQKDIRFKQLSPARFVEAASWRVDVPALHAEVVAQGHYPDISTLEAALSSLGTADPWLVVQGHDLVHILSIGLKRVLGSREPGSAKVSAALRLAVDRAEINNTPLWSDLRAWEGRNVPFLVLV